MEQKHMGLLDILAAKADCMYLSDLRQPQYLPYIQHTLRKFAPEKFSLWEWNDAVSYLTGKDCTFQVQGQAKEYLLHQKNNFDLTNGRDKL